MAFINLDKEPELPEPPQPKEYPLEQMSFQEEIVTKVGDFMEANPLDFSSMQRIQLSKQKILDKALNLTGTAYPEYIQALTEHLDKKIADMTPYIEG